ncbi:MAG TPA: ATP-binding protein [Pyrinomonadaceae bacterium]|jgi:two-component system NtrC family sensor kinase|nr:ATP-binding protein [Pyrinomonadaceae bacterium]
MIDPSDNRRAETNAQAEATTAQASASSPVAPHDTDGGTNAGTHRSESATTLRSVVAMVRRVMRSDTASVATLSVAERTVTWKATSGFNSISDEDKEIVNPLRGMFAEQAASSADMSIIEVRNVVGGDLPASEFPLHSAEGLRDLALVRLRARGETLGLLVVGYRTAHRFTPEEKDLLDSLAEMAALALDNARLLETVSAGKKIWEQTFDAMPDGIIVHDASMHLTRCNAMAAEMMGFDQPADAIGLTCAAAFARLFGERAAAFHMNPRSVTGGVASSFEIQAEDGRRYLVAVAPLDGAAEGHGSSVITWSDVTQISEMQEQLSRSRRLATVGQLAAGVAHEINNPLAAITTCAEATLRDIRSTPDLAAVAEERSWNFYLEEIVRQALRCKAITRGLLDLSRQRRARREPCDVNALVERSVLLVSQREEARDVSLESALDPQIGELATDEVLVRQILDNLLTNALDAVEGHGSVRVTTALEGERARIEVADTGAGIPAEMLVRIFDPFYTTKEAGKGSGLGLAISATLAEALGGALTVESKPGAGSRFRLWLPRRAPEQRDEG